MWEGAYLSGSGINSTPVIASVYEHCSIAVKGCTDSQIYNAQETWTDALYNGTT